MVELPELGGGLVLLGILPLILGLLGLIYAGSRKVYDGFRDWVLAEFLLAAGFVLLASRPALPDFVSLILGNLFGLYCLVLVYTGTERFFDRRPTSLPNYIAIVLYLVAQLYLSYVAPDPNGRIVLASAVMAFLLLRNGLALLGDAPARLRRTSHTVSLVFFAATITALMRGAYALFQTRPIDLLTDPTFVALTLIYASLLIVWSFYALFLNSARVELDLEDAGRQLAQAAEATRRDASQLSLLEQAGQLVARSLDEDEILKAAVDAVVERFGYAEAAVSMLIADDRLELRAISGSESLGYQVGSHQHVGLGIIGHVARTGEVHVAADVQLDPYYFTIGKPSGSAAGIPLCDDEHLLGVLYVESRQRDAFGENDVRALRALGSHVVTAVNKARLHAGTQDHLMVMTTLHRISQIVTSSLELDRIFGTVLQLLQETFGYTHVGIYLLDRGVLRLQAQVGFTESTLIQEIAPGEGIVGRTFRTRQTQFVRDVSEDPEYIQADAEIGSEICVPLLKQDSVQGVIDVESSRRRPLGERDVDVLQALAGPISIAIENAHLHAQATALARVDGLTDLMNRRTFDETLEAELKRARRYDLPLTLMIIDIDDFKAVNDLWGHPAGDALLRTIAHLIRSNVRGSDSAARFGGDEFAVILPNTGLKDALDMAERLRQTVEQLGRDSRDAQDKAVPAGDYSISIGVASFPGSAQSADELLLAADHAELRAKQQGKNRVSTAEDAAPASDDLVEANL